MSDHFARYNAFVEGGWLGRLSKVEIGVWFAYERHADAAGESFPSNDRVARYLGNGSPRHVQRARLQLISRGLLELVKTARARDAAVYRVRVPESPMAESATPNVWTGGGIRPPRTFGRVAESAALGMAESAAPSTHRRDHTPKGGARARRSQSPAGVDAIYDAYPRKLARGAAVKAIAKALAEIGGRLGAPPDPAAWLLERVRLFAASPAGRRGTYTPYPATWFNQARYDDDPAEWNQRDRSDNATGWREARKQREFPEPPIDARRFTVGG
jgi:hypothetical protein